MKIFAIPSLLMASVCATVGFYEFLTWSRRKGRRRDIAFAFICLGGTIYCLACAGEYNVDLPAQSVPWLRIQSITLMLTTLAFLWYLSEETGLVHRRVLIAFIALYGLLAFTQALGLGDLTWKIDRPSEKPVRLPFGIEFKYLEVETGPLTVLAYASAILVLPYLFWIAAKYSHSAERRDTVSLYVFLTIVSLAFFNDYCVNAGIYSFVFTMEYAWLAVIILVGLKRSTEVLDAAVAKRALEISEAQLIASLAEKSLLLKEVHHRVKNNLQLVSSLLFLHAGKVSDPGFKAILQDCRAQVASMALIHEDLYRSQDLSSVDFGSYLHGLVRRILAAFPSSGAVFVPSIESLRLGIDKAIPCALIVNELCTNAFKHAFPPGFEGRVPEIRIEFKLADRDRISLAVSDNGIGLPPGFDLETADTLGMRIISKLSEQLGGGLRIEPYDGARFVIDFPRSTT